MAKHIGCGGTWIQVEAIGKVVTYRCSKCGDTKTRIVEEEKPEES